MARIGSQTYQPATCACVIAQGVFETAGVRTVEAESIVRHCDAPEHEAISDAADLLTAIRLEVRAYSAAVAAVRVADNAFVHAWYVGADRVVNMCVRGADAGLKTTLAAISNLAPTYYEDI